MPFLAIVGQGGSHETEGAQPRAYGREVLLFISLPM